jgi:hypothetical protein
MSIAFNWRDVSSKRLRDLVVRRHGWVYLLTVGLWVVAATYVLTAKDVALAHIPETPTTSPLVGLSLTLGQPNNITYQVLSPTNAKVTVSYLDEQGQAKLYTGPSPWSLTLKTSDIGFTAGVTALSASDSVSCRISVDGKVTDEKTGTGASASVSCNLVAFHRLSG